MEKNACQTIPTIQCQLNCPYHECNRPVTAHELKLSDSLDLDISPKPLPDDYRARWRLKNIERDRENKRRHYSKNYEEYKQRRERYYLEHKEEILSKQHEYYQKNKAVINARTRDKKRERWSENPELYREKQRQYRARKKIEK